MIDTNRLIETFFSLVSITSPSFHEREVADYITQKLLTFGFTIKEDNTGEKISGNCGNLIATLQGNNSDMSALFFATHMDTVAPCQNVRPKRNNGIITANGDTILGADDKAGIAALLEAMEVLTTKQLPHGTLTLIFTVAEEAGLYGAKYLNASDIHGDFGYCLDSSGRPGKIIVQAPGENEIAINLHGKAAHAGIAPETGINAIVTAAKAILAIPQGRIDHETTTNLGIINGGRATNIVPDLVELRYETRSHSENKLSAQTKAIIDCYTAIAQANQATTNIKVEYCFKPYMLSEMMPVIKTATQAIQNLNLPLTLAPSGGGSDANFFNEHYPCANLAVGMTKVHTTEEFILEEDLEMTAKLLLEIITESH